MPDRITIKAEVIKGVLTVSLSGELDIYTVPAVRNSLQLVLDKGIRFLIVDISDLNYVDSSGIGTLVKVQKTIVAKSGSFCLILSPGYISDFFQKTFLNRVLKFFFTQTEGIEYIKSNKLFFPAVLS